MLEPAHDAGVALRSWRSAPHDCARSEVEAELDLSRAQKLQSRAPYSNDESDVAIDWMRPRSLPGGWSGFCAAGDPRSSQA